MQREKCVRGETEQQEDDGSPGTCDRQPRGSADPGEMADKVQARGEGKGPLREEDVYLREKSPGRGR